jgi:hypothetical protein
MKQLEISVKTSEAMEPSSSTMPGLINEEKSEVTNAYAFQHSFAECHQIDCYLGKIPIGLEFAPGNDQSVGLWLSIMPSSSRESNS